MRALAKITGRNIGTVRHWRGRQTMNLPAADGYVSGSPWWWWPGRLKPWIESRPDLRVVEEP